MRIYYIDEAEGPTCYVRSALGVNAERWNGLHGSVHSWRYAMAGDYNVPTSRELRACDLLARRGNLVRIDSTGAGSPLSRGPRSSWTACASSRAPPMGGAASRWSTYACARPT